MKRLIAIFVTIILLTLGSFAILWAISPEEERENVLSTQGIRLVGSTVVNTQGTSSIPTRIKVGDLLMGNDERVYRINELRKGQTDVIYVVVSWKRINNYTSYEHYLSEPYSNHATYEIRAFAYNKTITTEADIRKFYADYSQSLKEQIEEERERALTARAIMQQPETTEAPTASLIVAAPPPPPPPSQAAIPRSKPSIVNRESTAYSVVELETPDDLSEHDIEDLNRNREE